jgi:hypothetical protein
MDIVDIHVGLDGQVVLRRDDIHDLLAPTDDAANGEDAESDDIAAIGCTNLRPIEHVLRCLEARNHIENLRLSVSQILGDFGHPIVLGLDDMELELTDRLARAGDIARYFAGLARQRRCRPLELQHARALRKPFRQEFALVIELGGYQRELLPDSGLLRLEAANLLLQLLDPLVQYRDLTLEGRTADFELLGLGVQ